MFPLVRRGELSSVAAGSLTPRSARAAATAEEATSREDWLREVSSRTAQHSSLPRLSLLCARYVTQTIENGFNAEKIENQEKEPVCVPPATARRRILNSKTRHVIDKKHNFYSFSKCSPENSHSGPLYGNITARLSKTLFSVVSQTQSFLPSQCAAIRFIVKLLKHLDKAAGVSQLVQQAGPLSTALYCALSTIEGLEYFDINNYNYAGTAFNRVLDPIITASMGAQWKNLKRLNMKGCCIEKRFFEILAAGNAARTLEALDISSTFVVDEDILGLAPFSALMHLDMNQCQLITSLGIQNIVTSCPQLHSLSLNNCGVDSSSILNVLAGSANTDPLPLLSELRMETDSWSHHIQAIRSFLERRKHLARFRVWNFIPILDYGDPSLYAAILQKCSLQTLNVKLENIELLSMAPDVRSLQLQTPAFGQAEADQIAQFCPKLQTLILTSTKISMTNVDFSVLGNLKELSLVDVQLGKISQLPNSLRSLTATIGIIAMNSCADLFIGAIASCKTLQRVQLCTSQLESRTASFTTSTVRVLLESLPLLEDLTVDRELFGRDSLTRKMSIIPMVHNKLTRVKLICSLERGCFPSTEYTPSLRYFETTNHKETLASLPGLCKFSHELSSAILKFDRALLQQADGLNSANSHRSKEDNSDMMFRIPRKLSRKRSRSFTSARIASASTSGARLHTSALSGHQQEPIFMGSSTEISGYLQQLSNLSNISLSGATDLIVSSLPSFRYLTKMRLINSDVQTHFIADLVSGCLNLRDVSLERCAGIDSVEALKSPKLAQLSLSGCPDLQSKLSLDGSSFPALEILRITNQHKLGSVTVSNMHQLKWLTIQNTNATSLRVFGVPQLLDLALETVTVLSMKIEASNLLRLFLDCGRTYLSYEDLDQESSDVNLTLSAPKLRSVSWQADDTPIGEAIEFFASLNQLRHLELPSIFVEDLDTFACKIREACPFLVSVGCGDGDVQFV